MYLHNKKSSDENFIKVLSFSLPRCELTKRSEGLSHYGSPIIPNQMHDSEFKLVIAYFVRRFNVLPWLPPPRIFSNNFPS